MKFTALIASAVMAASVNAYTEVTQWSGYNCGRGDGFRTSYLHIYGEGVYINRDRGARSIYIEQYDASPPTYFFSDFNGGGFLIHGLRTFACYVWSDEGALSIASPYNGGRFKRAEALNMTEGLAVEIDELHLGLGGATLLDIEN
ncbi:uncharacterized protein K489DRAFT_404013 [Dissoconium aciculare CBS 342.82]|uniref:Uncharacterized protein n=1 Tax=Dissoconium aciculare CBS 342.82 TaxID=1314786 RepID=A0A6J3LWI9_9PEZI|nr:uncharacterized protein K489DRAFT_404013 [Dissoconium aciculare CBS 342.82]KAF1820018.1 hypothetical protein K489DRAFT_404013 [Dissoconium aciculare CBS 342.82]